VVLSLLVLYLKRVQPKSTGEAQIGKKCKGKSKDSDVRVVEFKDDFRLTPTVFTPAVKALAVVRSHFLELFAS
jgi:hypothetical protein